MAREPDGLEIGVDEFPVLEGFLVRGEVVGVADAGIFSERDVELALAVEAAQPVEAGAIQVIEQRRPFRGVLLAVGSPLKRARWR